MNKNQNNNNNSESGWNAFLYAVLNGHIAVMQYLIEKGMFTPEDIDMAVLISASRRHFNFDTLRFLWGYFSTQIGDEQQLTALAENSDYGRKQKGYFDGWKWNLRSTKELILLENNAPQLKKLETNVLSANKDFMFKYLEKNDYIEQLTFCHSWSSAENLESLLIFLRRTSSLKELYITRSNSVVKEIFEALIDNKNSSLEVVDLWDSVPDATGLTTLADFIQRNKTIQQLSISNKELGDEAMKIIVDAINTNPTTLKALLLHFNQISWMGAKALTSLLRNPNTVLTKLNINGFPSAGDSIAEILEAAIKNTHLSEIVLPRIHTNISQAIFAISDLIANHETLTDLRIYPLKFTDEQGAKLCDALRVNNKLKKIDFSESGPEEMFSEKTAKVLNEALAKNTTIEAIDFSGHKEFGKCVKYFTEGLSKNKSLKYLNLGYTNVDDENFIALINAIHSNQTLLSLRIACAKIGEKSINKLAELLAENKIPLQTLSLRFVDLDEKSYFVLFEALRKNTSLTNLTVGHDNFYTAVTVPASECLIQVLQESNFTLREIYGCRGEAQENEINKLLERNKQLAKNLPKEGAPIFSIFSGSKGKEEEKTDEEKILIMNPNQN